VERLPAQSFWSAAGIGRFQFGMNTLGLTLGGHARTGLEDNLYFNQQKKELATNETLVQRLANVAQSLERPLATPAEARSLIGLT
jgi:3-keto-5-aminohexanoate cleavage enzyme